MIHGKRADGSDIDPEYTYLTRLGKMRKGRDPEIVTLYDAGDFYRGMFLDIGSDDLEIDSMDYKSDDLQSKYGEKIFGLTDESKSEFIEKSFPAFKSKIEENLKLEMK